MSYISLTFPLFIVFVVVLYFIAPLRWRWIVLLSASYLFYALSDVRCLIFVMLTTISTFYAAKLINRLNIGKKETLAHYRDLWSEDKKAAFIHMQRKKSRAALICAALLNFGILGFIKYYDFAAYNISALFHLPGNLWQLNLLLPIGISFYTFQSMGYVIDVYRDSCVPDRNIAKYALFVSFFPQILQGPIGRYDELAAQLTAPNRFSAENLKSGLQLVLWGYLKKLVIADRIAALVITVFDKGNQFGFFLNSVGVLAYGLQIYCDFSGGIDISRGIAEIMGIRMAENFRRPYFAQTVSEYWKRWHITLGNWTRDYIFYPIVLSKGMSRLARKIRKKTWKHFGKVLPACIASLICFLIIGVWHGAAWKYVVYGLYYGFLISLSQLLDPVFNKLAAKLKINRTCFSWRLFGMLRTLFLVSIGRCFTRSGGFMDAVSMLRSSFTHWDPWTLWDGKLLSLGLTQKDYNILFVGILVLLTVGILQEKGVGVRNALSRQNLWFRWAIMIAAVLAIILFGVYGSKYNASSFIYAQF
jgi:D-alanyl-lipoteichoic acid acyltransferase DltB (MBOAT superfamily)